MVGQGQLIGVTQPPQIEPLEAPKILFTRLGPVLIQQLFHAVDVAFLPSLKGNVHVRSVELTPDLPGLALRRGAQLLGLLALPALLGLRRDGALAGSLGLASEPALLFLGRHGPLAGGFFPGVHPRRNSQTDHERRGDRTDGSDGEFVPADQLLDAIERAGRAGVDGFVMQMALDVRASPLAVS